MEPRSNGAGREGWRWHLQSSTRVRRASRSIAPCNCFSPIGFFAARADYGYNDLFIVLSFSSLMLMDSIDIVKFFNFFKVDMRIKKRSIECSGLLDFIAV